MNLRAKNVLRFWRQRKGNLATRNVVLQALEKIRNRHAIEQLEAEWNMKGELESYFFFKFCNSLFNMVRPIARFSFARGLSQAEI